MSSIPAIKLRNTLCIALIACQIAVAIPAQAQEGDKLSLTNEQFLELFSQTYFRTPRPEMIADALQWFSESSFARQENSWSGYQGFFAEVFANNPDRLGEWQRIIVDMPRNVRSVLADAVQLAEAGGPQSMKVISPSTNDLYWGAYFASGNQVYVELLADRLKYLPERSDRNLYLTGATAKWSLSANARVHDEVRAALKSIRAGFDPKIGAEIDDLLDKQPEQIRKENQAIYRDNEERGGWK